MNRDELVTFARSTIAPYAREVLDSVTLRPCEPGTDGVRLVRGIDHYGGRLVPIVVNALARFYVTRSRFPAHPCECTSIADKVFWSKFFVPLRLPTPADKLSVRDFIPTELADRVHPARVHWSSVRPDIPAEIAGVEGRCYLKSNNAYGTVEPVTYPLPEAERQRCAATGRAWLQRRPYNFEAGEWWYATITPKLYIEQDVAAAGAPAVEYKYWVIGGHTVCVHRPTSSGEIGKFDATTLYDPAGAYLSDLQYRGRPNPERPVSDDFEDMKHYAERIGAVFDFVRVDFYNPSPGVIVLGELTLCPTEGCFYYNSDDYEDALGMPWDFARNFTSRLPQRHGP